MNNKFNINIDSLVLILLVCLKSIYPFPINFSNFDILKAIQSMKEKWIIKINKKND